MVCLSVWGLEEVVGLGWVKGMRGGGRGLGGVRKVKGVGVEGWKNRVGRSLGWRRWVLGFGWKCLGILSI